MYINQGALLGYDPVTALCWHLLSPSLWVVIALTLSLMGASSPQDFLDHMIKIQKLRISEQSNSGLQT